jgi:hypothetical protein
MVKDGSRSTGSVFGIPVRADISSFDPDSNIVWAKLKSGQLIPVKLPAGWVGSRGQLSAGFPVRGTPIFVNQGQGGEYVFSGYDQPFYPSDYDGDGLRRVSSTGKLIEGRWLTLVENDVSLIVDPKDGVLEGDSIQFIQADPVKGIWSSRFLYEMHFSDAHREVVGPIRRDKDSNNSRNVAGSALTGHQYHNAIREIGLDPKTAPSISTAGTRNPTLAESRAMFYEFANSFGYTNDEEEERLYAGQDLPKTKPFQRKKSRTDTMSLSLDQPNFLAETIIGTVVDIYGNILDINRSVLPSGIIDSLNFKKSEENQEAVFTKLRAQLRKSIAYHFEINARKDSLSLPDYNSTADYARARSRFFFDIDKEGQFKMNVPASSEQGNVPVLVRHENFSNIKGAQENVDRGQFMRNVTTNTDVQLEPHGKGAVELKSNEETLKSYAAPADRFTGQPIKLGTGFHDISEMLELHRLLRPYSSDIGNAGYDDSLINKINDGTVPAVVDVVSSEVVVAGTGANAGGRSGTISCDGMVSISVGANTVDRQSMWLDLAGGMVGAIGRDRFNRSMSMNLDGDFYMQVGGATVNDDSRFPSSTFNNAARDGTIDIRIWNSGSFHTFRIDPEGIKIHTPQRIDIVSEGEMSFKSVNSNIYFDAESVFFYARDKNNPNVARLVERKTTGTSGRTL